MDNQFLKLPISGQSNYYQETNWNSENPGNLNSKCEFENLDEFQKIKDQINIDEENFNYFDFDYIDQIDDIDNDYNVPNKIKDSEFNRFEKSHKIKSKINNEMKNIIISKQRDKGENCEDFQDFKNFQNFENFEKKRKPGNIQNKENISNNIKYQVIEKHGKFTNIPIIEKCNFPKKLENGENFENLENLENKLAHSSRVTIRIPKGNEMYLSSNLSIKGLKELKDIKEWKDVKIIGRISHNSNTENSNQKDNLTLADELYVIEESRGIKNICDANFLKFITSPIPKKRDIENLQENLFSGTNAKNYIFEPNSLQKKTNNIQEKRPIPNETITNKEIDILYNELEIPICVTQLNEFLSQIVQKCICKCNIF